MQGGAGPRGVSYRPDIDGLRAVAVLAVIAYHLNRDVLPGGFLGVDIFFVMSGYLIISTAWHAASEGRFSIMAFYDRRLRRIMPALLLLLTVTTVVACVLLLPRDLIKYAKSLLSTLAFVPNIYFWRDTSYFAPNEEKPLLHMWSLGIEEQFYLLLPLFVVFAFARFRGAALPILVVGFALSLGLNVAALVRGSENPAFYLLPARAWELAAGGIVALLAAGVTPGRKTALGLSLTGAALIAVSLATPWFLTWSPMPAALPAVVGASMMLWTGTSPSALAGRLLTARPLVLIGLISYSLYLWHWPIIVFGQYYLLRPFSLAETAIAFVAMVLCAALSWRYVERPFRSPRMPIATVRWTALAVVAILAGAGLWIIWQAGLPSRLSPAATQVLRSSDSFYRCPASEYLDPRESRGCEMNLPSRRPDDAEVVLMGNSHSQMYAPVVRDLIEARGQRGMLLAIMGCMPTTGVNLSADCDALTDRNIGEVVALKNAHTVIIGTTWDEDRIKYRDRSVPQLSQADAFVWGLDQTIDRFLRSGKRVILIGPIATPEWDVPSVLSRSLAFNRPIARDLYMPQAEFEGLNGRAIAHFEGRRDILFLRPDRIQCRQDRCDFVRDGRSLFADGTHLGTDALPILRPMFEQALAGSPTIEKFPPDRIDP